MILINHLPVKFGLVREDELELTRQIDKGTIVVTGIGGQGKSLFTAKVLEDWLESNPKGFWDWRDCREYSERFRVQLESVYRTINMWPNTRRTH